LTLLLPRSFLRTTPPPPPTLFPYTTLFRSKEGRDSRPPRHPARLPLSGEQVAEHAGYRPHESSMPGIASGRILSRRPHQRRFLRSEEHTSELQSRFDLVCRLLLEKKKII